MKHRTTTHTKTTSTLKTAHTLSLAIYLVSAVGLATVLGGIVLQMVFTPATVASGVPVVNSSNSISVNWIAPPNASDAGVAPFEIRYATEPVTEATWELATPFQGVSSVVLPGSHQRLLISNLDPGATYYVALRTRDEQGSATVTPLGAYTTTYKSLAAAWTCSEWSTCQADVQHRACVCSGQACASGYQRPIEQQACQPIAHVATKCSERWSCSNWSTCSVGITSRGCVDLHQCGTFEFLPMSHAACTIDAPPDNPKPKLLVAALGAVTNATVKIINTDTQTSTQFFPLSRLGVGLSLSGGDVNGDGSSEVVVGSGIGTSPEVAVYSQTGKVVDRFYAFPKKNRSGVNVAVGDVDGDGTSDIITAPAGNFSSLVRIFRFDTAKQRFIRWTEFTYLHSKYRGGLNVAAGDADLNGYAEVVVTPAGPARVSTVEFFEFDTRQAFVTSRGSLEVEFNNRDRGISSVLSDVNGDGFRELAVAPGSGPVEVRVYSLLGKRISLLSTFEPSEQRLPDGAVLTTGDFNRDGQDELVVAPGRHGSPRISAFSWDASAETFSESQPAYHQTVFNPAYRTGVRIMAL